MKKNNKNQMNNSNKYVIFPDKRTAVCKSVFLLIFTFLFIFIAALLVFSVRWAIKTYDSIAVDEILYHLNMPLKNTEQGIINSFLKKALLPSIILTCIVLLIIAVIYYTYKNRSYNFKFFKSEIRLVVNRMLSVCLVISILATNVSLLYGIKTLNIDDYFLNASKSSTFIQENYVDPSLQTYLFPEKKRSLIHIYVESLETGYASKEEGGEKEFNLIPNLTKLAKDNISFSNNELLGGAKQVRGTTYTASALVAQTSGLPIKIGINEYDYVGQSSLLKGAYTLGDILNANGYNQMFLIGSDAEYGARRLYFEDHGNYEIFDYFTAKAEGRFPSDYVAWWGFEDSKLFDYSKEKILELASQDKPFNFTTLTTTTHFYDGFIEQGNNFNFPKQYDNAIAFSDKQVYEFVKWIMGQDFYENTTIVITGDHLTMQPDYVLDKNKRHIYNCFINAPVTAIRNKNRQFCAFDIFPTTLASLGITWSGNRLALGTNLFSGEITYLEKYGFDYVDVELGKKSLFYNNKIVYDK